jgi:ATP-binding cassette subfamily B protein
VFRGLSFAIAPGERVAIVGESGAGKSTLLRLVLRLCDPNGGSLRIDGRDIREYELGSLRSQIGVVLPDAVLFAASIRDNIAWAAPSATREQVEAAAALAKVEDFASALPEGLDTYVGESGATLSRGQRQRIAIARGIVREAPILLLDEPMTGLDAENAGEVSKALDAAMAGRTCLLVTHDLSVASRCDRIVVVERGRAVEVGSHRDLLERSGLYASLWSKQPSPTRIGEVQDQVHAVGR